MLVIVVPHLAVGGLLKVSEREGSEKQQGTNEQRCLRKINLRVRRNHRKRQLSTFPRLLAQRLPRFRQQWPPLKLLQRLQFRRQQFRSQLHPLFLRSPPRHLLSLHRCPGSPN